MTTPREAFKREYGLVDQTVKDLADRAIAALRRQAKHNGGEPIDLQHAVAQLEWDDKAQSRRMAR